LLGIKLPLVISQNKKILSVLHQTAPTAIAAVVTTTTTDRNRNGNENKNPETKRRGQELQVLILKFLYSILNKPKAILNCYYGNNKST
jgi:hypothetical protein